VNLQTSGRLGHCPSGKKIFSTPYLFTNL